MRSRPRVLRAYDTNGRLRGGRVINADDSPEHAVTELFADPQVAVIHARAVVESCFTFAVRRRR